MCNKILQGKTAVVTGGSRGIGRAIALKLAEIGANIVVNYRNSANVVEDIIKEIESRGVKAIAVQGDVSNFKDAEKIIKAAVEEFGSLDILVNNAGITADGLLMRMKEEDFDKVIQVNLKGAFNCIRHASSIMLKQRYGKIINISSVIGITGNAGQANYAAAKAGIIGLTKSAAKELASRGINVNAVAPGFIETDMTDSLSEKVKEGALANIPLKRFGKAEDVAEVVAFLSSDNSSYITGQVLNVDGGMVI
ncbi:3-oxoacyl-[acyl-carrier protein] reductase [Clostridium tetanomorphum]|uniref:3-oxoacyl-[acyl-carrier-protein] reductase n=1 Tax=Clostridium tetanomorphum TaxID=1553 RepID=A0A923EB22_CLOTT|nr:3-oxoacyl-[acyl-carrier-protein] reductase [Clostridium tetanomorphum]KAJ49293.1 3-oxoacyl-ACP reductase [Clostridium tetanomorphum DSM 665]KAJ53056.1 3-oxoacyl-ACP reductase [Clostridium tetanomorphum DSM 665]MBC2398406.1 3-oxoacyl-[acyl-carrier-protein] reductase [Clostridium tetanomorphum]MBP1865559.1 3-oxoacyl-[acyl-carrier protein] reductase [Clostridium tetanomorphum]NRS86505.1 3-oxoacyl-[acyl-carrier protein] reductase [Clostridium tetanomorphum]